MGPWGRTVVWHSVVRGELPLEVSLLNPRVLPARPLQLLVYEGKEGVDDRSVVFGGASVGSSLHAIDISALLEMRGHAKRLRYTFRSL